MTTTMRRRIIAGFTALALALFGAVVLVQYVRGADERAQAGEEQVSVLVVGREVPAGADVATVRSAVVEEQVPARLLSDGALTDVAALDALAGRQTTAALLAGEQVRTARFAVPDPDALEPDGSAPVPAGMVEMSLTLEPQRALGGQLAPHDVVDVVVSTPETIPGTTTQRPVSRQALGDVLVTRVDDGGSASSEDGAATAAGTDAVTVTLAVLPQDAPVLAAGAELGTVWLTLVTDASSDDTTLTATTPSGGDK
jgi:pilus assembly protein CpaB